MKIKDFIKAGGAIEDLYFDNINTVTRIPIIDPHTKHLELVMVVDPKRPTTYFNTFTDAEKYIQQL